MPSQKKMAERSSNGHTVLGAALRARLPTVWTVESSRPWPIVARAETLSKLFQTVFWPRFWSRPCTPLSQSSRDRRLLRACYGQSEFSVVVVLAFRW